MENFEIGLKSPATPLFLIIPESCALGKLMKCPECGNEMENGLVSGARRMVWRKKPIKFLLSGDIIAAKRFFNH